MRAIDTHVLVRLLTRDDARQVAAAERFVAKGAWVSHLVLVEAVWVLDSVYELGSTEIARSIEMLLNHRDLMVQQPEAVALAIAQFRMKPSVGFSDCLVLEVARQAGHLPLRTFDRNLGKRNGAERL